MANDSTRSNAVYPLFEWLTRLGVITSEEEKVYKYRKPHVFFDMLRDGYLLSKIAMVAVPANAQYFRNDMCKDAATRYDN